MQFTSNKLKLKNLSRKKNLHKQKKLLYINFYLDIFTTICEKLLCVDQILETTQTIKTN